MTIIATPLKSVLRQIVFQRHLTGGEKVICCLLTTCFNPENADPCIESGCRTVAVQPYSPKWIAYGGGNAHQMWHAVWYFPQKVFCPERQHFLVQAVKQRINHLLLPIPPATHVNASWLSETNHLSTCSILSQVSKCFLTWVMESILPLHVLSCHSQSDYRFERLTVPLLFGLHWTRWLIHSCSLSQLWAL